MAKLERNLQKTNKDQYILTIPKQIIDLLGWKDKLEIEFGFDEGKVTLQKYAKRA